MIRRNLYLILMATAVMSLSAHAFEPRFNPFAIFDKRGAPPSQPPDAPRGESAAGAPSGGESLPVPFEERALRAVMVNGAASFANVEGVLVQLGGTLDNWRLTEVGPHSAVFVQATRRVTLQLQRPQAGAAKPAAPSASSPSEPTPPEGQPAAGLVDKLKGVVQ